MESDGKQRGKTVGCLSNEESIGNNTAENKESISNNTAENKESIGKTTAEDELQSTSETSFITTTTDSIMSIASDELDETGEPNETIIEVTREFEKEEPDYKAMYEKYKKLLDDRTEHLKSEMSALGKNVESKNSDYKQLRDAYTELEALKEEADKELKLKTEHISRLEARIGITICNDRNKDIIKAKAKRTGSKININIQTNKCEFPNCSTVDADLALCSSCGTYVCEKCNEVPINKLKQIVKVCDSIYFLCKDCNTKITDYHNPELHSIQNSEKLQEEVRDKIKIIERAEANQKILNDLILDRNEMIESQKTIIESTKADLQKMNEDLHDSRNLWALKEEELKQCRNELQIASDKNHESLGTESISQLKETNDTLLKKLNDQKTLTMKTELAFETQDKLIASKCELIESLKMQLSHNKESPSCYESEGGGETNLTSQSTLQGKEKEDGVEKNNYEKIPG